MLCCISLLLLSDISDNSTNCTDKPLRVCIHVWKNLTFYFGKKGENILPIKPTVLKRVYKDYAKLGVERLKQSVYFWSIIEKVILLTTSTESNFFQIEKHIIEAPGSRSMRIGFGMFYACAR